MIIVYNLYSENMFSLWTEPYMWARAAFATSKAHNCDDPTAAYKRKHSGFNFFL